MAYEEFLPLITIPCLIYFFVSLMAVRDTAEIWRDRKDITPTSAFLLVIYAILGSPWLLLYFVAVVAALITYSFFSCMASIFGLVPYYIIKAINSIEEQTCNIKEDTLKCMEDMPVGQKIHLGTIKHVDVTNIVSTEQPFN